MLCSRVHQDVSALPPCSHEEADTRMFLHAKDAAQKGHRRIMLRTVDTEVVVLAVSTIVLMENTQLWIAFGKGKHLRYIPAHEIATSLGAEKAQALPMFHAFTGVTQSRRLLGKAKRQPSTRGGHSMLQRRSSLDLSHDRQVWTMFACLYSSHTWCLCMIGGVTNYCGLSQEAHVHVKNQIYRRHSTNQRCTAAACKTSNIAGWPCMGSGPSPRSRSSFSRVLGMKQESDAAVSCSVLLRCGCKKGCRGLCKCVKANLKCTSPCHCCDNCKHSDHY